MILQNKNFILSFVYFLLATILSGIFIANNAWLYRSEAVMILSGSIAGAKWAIQIVAALILLREKQWLFIKRLGFVCFIGSAILFVYYIFNLLPLGRFSPFVLSIGLSVVTMIVMYYQAVKKTGLSVAWFLGWILCLVIAILLQVFVVF